MVDDFYWSEFGSDEGDLDADQYFENLQFPELGYAHIQKSIQAQDEGLEAIEDDELRRQVEIYSHVAVFREVMQYAEEFGIYFNSKLDAETDFVDALTRTQVHQTKSLFKLLRDQEYEGIEEEYLGDDSNFDDWIVEQFGYDIAHAQWRDDKLSDVLETDAVLKSENIEDIIELSIEAIKRKLTNIGRYFLQFDEAYNALKHGNRVFPTESLNAKYQADGTEVEIDSDEPFVTFLCKASNERRQGKRYTLTIPVQFLQRESGYRAEEIHSLYTHLYRVAQVREAAGGMTEEELRNHTFDISLYGARDEETSGESYHFQVIDAPDGGIWIPEEMLDEDLPEPDFAKGEFTAALKIEGGELVIETDGSEEPSYEQPIRVEGSIGKDPNRLVGSRAELNFNWNLLNLPLWQYLELVDLMDESPFDSVIVRHSGEGEEHRQNLNVSVGTPSVPEPTDRGQLEFIYRLGLAADTKIFTPAYIPEPAADVLESYRGENLTSELAERILDEIFEATEDEMANYVQLRILDVEGYTGDQYPIIRSSNLGVVQGSIVCELGDNDQVVGFTMVDAKDDRVKKGEPGEIEGLVIGPINHDPETTFEMFEKNGLQAIHNLEFHIPLEDSEGYLEMNREYGPQYTWYKLDKFQINIFIDMPLHAEDFILENFD